MANIVKLSKPVKFEENTIEEINMNLDDLTGRDISKVKSEWSMTGKFSPVPATDIDFCIMVAARASNQPIDLFDVLPAKDYLKVSQEVSNFLMG